MLCPPFTSATVSSMKPFLVLGVGNILLRDEGIGVRAIEAMREMDWPVYVELMDGGTGGTDVVEIVAGRRKVIIIDAIDTGAKPGTIVRLKPDDLASAARTHLSLRGFGLPETLQLARQLGSAPGQVVVIGIQIETMENGLELSPKVAAAIPRVIEAVRAEI